jgi:hypothetical protein
MASLAGAPDKRDLAARARRMAQSLTVESDRGRLMRYAEELDHEADELERDFKSRKTPPQ